MSKECEAYLDLCLELAKVYPYCKTKTAINQDEVEKCLFCHQAKEHGHATDCLYTLSIRLSIGLPVIAKDDNDTEQLKQEISELTQETLVDNTIIADYKRVLDAIPACPAHGSDCVPHAVEWVERVKTLGATITGFGSKD